MSKYGVSLILLVEDEAIIAMEEAMILRSEGYEVVQAFSGEEAVLIAGRRNASIDMILMDIDLGSGIDGTEAARQILEFCDIPIVFLSSHTEKEIVDKTEKITSYGYIVKNFPPIILNTSIKMAHKLYLEKKRVKESNDALAEMNENLKAVNSELIKWRLEEEKRSKELRESDRRFRSIVEGAPVPIFIQTDKKFAFLNHTALKLFGAVDHAELIGKNVFERFHPDYHDKINERIKKINEKGSPVRDFFKQRFIRLDGSEVWVETVGEPVEYEGKKGAIVFAREIAAASNAGDALLAEESHYDSLFENNHAVMLLIDPESGQIYDSNPAAVRFYGWTREEICRMKISEINTLSIEEIKAEMNLAVKLKRNHFHFKHRLADGSVRNVEVYSGPITVKGKHLLYSIVYDITERLAAEDKIKALLAEKEIIVKEVHHRVKNNLNTICSFLNLQSAKSTNPETHEALSEACGRVRSMGILYERLSFSEYDGKMRVNEYFPALIRNITEAFGLGEEILIESVFDESEIKTKTMFSLGIIVTELVSNSIKYAFSDKKYGKITVRIYSDKEKFYLLVSDNGSGIDEAENVSGLGMRLVEMLVQQMDAKMKRSNEGGTNYEISFVPEP
ncbi:MAG TPA: PAS domain S-box protein [Spirochaetota bacterium]|nr:PAS domain S-box protein [Spirochaetota bacterium]HOR45459.1 PAS domain S-box protein [Spirochaetota bacterium]HPK57098.1 PAS domain S-box protein [Spirochaetota bacterium]